MGLHAMRCAPFSSDVRTRSSFSRSMASCASTAMAGLATKISRFAFEHTAAALFANESPVAHLHLTANHDNGRAPLDRPSLEGVVVVVGVLCGRGNCAAVLRIVDHKVSIRASCNHALPWSKAKQLRRTSAERIHEPMDIDNPPLH